MKSEWISSGKQNLKKNIPQNVRESQYISRKRLLLMKQCRLFILVPFTVLCSNAAETISITEVQAFLPVKVMCIRWNETQIQLFTSGFWVKHLIKIPSRWVRQDETVLPTNISQLPRKKLIFSFTDKRTQLIAIIINWSIHMYYIKWENSWIKYLYSRSMHVKLYGFSLFPSIFAQKSFLIFIPTLISFI